MIAMSLAAQMRFSSSASCGFTKEPVGLFGCTTSTARHREAASVCAFHRGLHRLKVDLPSVVIHQFVRFQLHVLQVGEKIEKRVAWRRNQDRVSRIAQQPKQKRVRLAGAGGQDEIVRRDTRLPCAA